MANKLKTSTRDAIHSSATTALIFRGTKSFVVIFLDPNEVDLQYIGGGHNEVGDGTNSPLARPFGRVKVIGVDGRDFRWSRAGGGMGNESGGAVLDAGGPVHHLESRVAHLGSQSPSHARVWERRRERKTKTYEPRQPDGVSSSSSLKLGRRELGQHMQKFHPTPQGFSNLRISPPGNSRSTILP